MVNARLLIMVSIQKIFLTFIILNTEERMLHPISICNSFFANNLSFVKFCYTISSHHSRPINFIFYIIIVCMPVWWEMTKLFSSIKNRFAEYDHENRSVFKTDYISFKYFKISFRLLITLYLHFYISIYQTFY